jgi:CheY-like chemotaxis protein
MTYLAGQQHPKEDIKKYLDKIDTSSRFLLSLINDILDMSKTESNMMELNPEPYSPEEFASYIDAVIRPLTGEKDQQMIADVHIPEGFIPVFDKLRINQVVFNILSNAVKYTPQGGIISYSARGAMTGENSMHMHIEVSDSGIGMSREFQQRIFEPFTQEHAEDINQFSGTGLGMAITKGIIDAMGGTIEMESEEGKGTRFIIDMSVPAVTRDSIVTGGQKSVEDKAYEDSRLLGRKILLCEDQAINQEIARTLLENKGMIVDVASNGQEALDIFEKSEIGYYDDILMDIRMPIMNGYEATTAIRSLERADGATVAIIAMTADAFENDIKKCLDAGMNAHVAKPIEPDRLYSVIASTK